MGEGFKIWDVTDQWQPTQAGGYQDAGWQNDIQVRGDVAVSTFDGVAGEPSSASTCLKTKHPTGRDQGVDIYRLRFDPNTAEFTVSLEDCVADPPGGAHNSTLHQSGDYLAISNPSSDWAVDVVDLRPSRRRYPSCGGGSSTVPVPRPTAAHRPSSPKPGAS